jgi:hypothetical protein
VRELVPPFPQPYFISLHLSIGNELPVLDNWSLLPRLRGPAVNSGAPPSPLVPTPRRLNLPARVANRSFLTRLRTPRRASMVLIGVNLTDSQSDDDDETSLVPQTRTVRSKSMGAAPPHLFASDVDQRGESILDGLVWSSEDDDEDDDDVLDDDGRSRRHAVDVDDLSFSTAATSSNERANGGGDAVRRDRYKFELDPRFLKYELMYLERKLKLERKSPTHNNNKKDNKMWSKTTPLKKEVVRAGIPPTHRRLVWLRATRASELILHTTQSNDSYASMSKRAQGSRDPTLALPVQADVHRMLPGHPILDAPAGTAKLRRVLATYFARNSTIAYCAALPVVAGVLTLFVAEEEAFFMLTMLVEQILPSQYYTANMCDIRVDCRVLSALVQERLPKLALHFAKTGAQQLVESVVVQWLLCLYVVGMPTETTLRIWDCLLCGEGNPVLLRMAVALLKLNESELLATDDPESLMLLLYDLPKRCFDVEQLFDIAFKRVGKFPLGKINDLRAQQKPGVMLELRQAMDHRRELEKAARAVVASQQLHTTPSRAAHSPARSPPGAANAQGDGASAAAAAAAVSSSPAAMVATVTSGDADASVHSETADGVDGDGGAGASSAATAAGAAAAAASVVSPVSPKTSARDNVDRTSPPKAAERRPSGLDRSPIVRGRRSSIDEASGDTARARVMLLNSASAVDVRSGVENVDPQVDSRDESEKTVGNDVADATSLASSLSSSSSRVSRSPSARDDDNAGATTDEAEAVEDEEAEVSMRRNTDPRPLVRALSSRSRRRHRDSMRGQSGTQSESEDSTSSVTLVQSQSRHGGGVAKASRASNWRRSPHRRPHSLASSSNPHNHSNPS